MNGFMANCPLTRSDGRYVLAVASKPSLSKKMSCMPWYAGPYLTVDEKSLYAIPRRTLCTVSELVSTPRASCVILLLMRYSWRFHWLSQT